MLRLTLLTRLCPFTNMDVGHVVEETKKKQKITSVFSLFSNLFSEKGSAGKDFVSLINSVSDGGFNVGSSSNLQYSLKRFVRGLASSQLNPQCASFAGLTCFLKFHLVSVDEVLSVLDAELKGNFSRGEQGLMNASCVLTCGAIIHSGIFADLPTETKLNILNKLIESGKTKSYLSSASHRFLVEVVSTADEESFRDVIWPVCKKGIKAALNDSDIDNYDFLLVCHSRFPTIVDKFILKLESSFELFIEKIISLLVTGHVRHDNPVYERVVQELVMNKKLLVKLWTECVNSESKNSFKDKTVITLFHFIMKHLNEEKVVPKLLVPRFIQTLIMALLYRNTKREEDKEYHILAKTSLSLLVNLLIREGVSSSVRFKTISKLMFYPANMKFERKTGTKCIQSLVMHLDASSLKELTKIHRSIISGELKKIVDEEGNSEDWNNNEKQYVLHIFVKLLNYLPVKNDKEWRLEQIKFLFDTGFLKDYKVHSSLQKCARDCFYKAIEIQMSNLEDVLEVLDNLVLHVNDRITSGKVVLWESGVESWKKAFNTIEKLKMSNEKLFVAVHLFLIHMGLQLFSDGRLAEFNIEELLACYSKLKNMQKKKEKSKDKEDLHWSEVTVDLMLSLLSRENKLWRYVVSSLVFPQMVKHITPSALHQIIDVLNPNSGNKVLNGEQSDDSDAFECDDDDEEEKDEDEDEDKEESSLTESDNEENVTLNDQLRSAVKDALGMSAALTDQESVDMDDMDAEEERKLNERLAAAFKMFKPNIGRNTKKQSKEEKALTHFRIRVLDLVEIYLTHGPTITGCLDLLLPLFNLLEVSIKDPHQRALQQRVDAVLKKLSALKKFREVEDITQELILDHFEVILSRKELPSTIFVEMSPRIADCCNFLVRCSNLAPNDSEDIPLVSNYVSLLENFVHSRDNKLPFAMFHSVLRSAWPGNWKLISVVYDLLVHPTIKLFKKMKMIELLEVFYKNSKLHSSGNQSVLAELDHVENQFISRFIDYQTDYDMKKIKPNEKMFAAFYTKILSLISIANKSLKRHRPESEKPPQWRNLILKMAEVSVVLSNKKSKKLLMALANRFDVKIPEGARQRTLSESSVQKDETTDGTEDTAEIAEATEKKKRKRKSKPSAEKSRTKKESTRLREAVSSDGIGTVSFSSVDVFSLPQTDESADDEKPKKKRKKVVATNGDLKQK